MTQREKDREAWRTFRTSDRDTFADGAVYARREVAEELRKLYATGDWADVRDLCEKLESDE